MAQRRVLSLYLVFEHRDPFDEIDKVGMVRMQQPAMQQPATTNNACAVTQCGCACACASDECADSSVNTPQQCESNRIESAEPVGLILRMNEYRKRHSHESQRHRVVLL